jgi:hypothetical protein
MKWGTIFTLLLQYGLDAQNPAAIFPNFYFDNNQYRWEITANQSMNGAISRQNFGFSAITKGGEDTYFTTAAQGSKQNFNVQLGTFRLSGMQKKVGTGLGISASYGDSQKESNHQNWSSDLGYFGHIRASDRFWITSGFSLRFMQTEKTVERRNDETELGLIWFVRPNWKMAMQCQQSKRATNHTRSFMVRAAHRYSPNSSIELNTLVASQSGNIQISLGLGYKYNRGEYMIRVNYSGLIEQKITHQLQITIGGKSFPRSSFLN